MAENERPIWIAVTLGLLAVCWYLFYVATHPTSETKRTVFVHHCQLDHKDHVFDVEEHHE